MPGGGMGMPGGGMGMPGGNMGGMPQGQSKKKKEAPPARHTRNARRFGRG